MTEITYLKKIGSRFSISGDFVEASPLGMGHINETFAVTYNDSGRRKRYVFQRINRNIFNNIPSLMDNIRRVTEHLRKKYLAMGEKDAHRRSLNLIPTRDDRFFYEDDMGEVWRVYDYVEGASVHQVVINEKHAFEAARLLGEFHHNLLDLPPPPPVEIIPHFHDTSLRVLTLKKVIQENPVKRVSIAGDEIDQAMRYEYLAAELAGFKQKAVFAERVTHNDTKINNFMIDDETGEGVCIVDLDTVWKGLSIYDFGDIVRTAPSSAAEDEHDLSIVQFRLNIFEKLASGYLSVAKQFLRDTEVDKLVFSGKLMAYMIGIRFLSDFLNGDTYFRVKYETHNLDRCRTQFKLLDEVVRLEEPMQKIVDKYR